MTYQSKVGETIDTLESCLRGQLSDEQKQQLDAGRTDPDVLWEAITGPDGLLMKAFSQLSLEMDEITRCLAVYVEAVERTSVETKIHMGIPYAMARAAYRFTEEERKRMAKGDAS